jgi:hypothetical protein
MVRTKQGAYVVAGVEHRTIEFAASEDGIPFTLVVMAGPSEIGTLIDEHIKIKDGSVSRFISQTLATGLRERMQEKKSPQADGRVQRMKEDSKKNP